MDLTADHGPARPGLTPAVAGRRHVDGVRFPTMRLYDQHLHSWFSFDCRTDPEANVRAALDRGLGGLTFTEHFDLHPEEWPTCTYDHDRYSACIGELRERYRGRIRVGLGIEVGYYAPRMDDILERIQGGPGCGFDLVILSFHHLDGRPIHLKEAWGGHNAESGTRTYLEGVLQGVRHCAALRREHGRVFDVLGHLDLAKRYTQRFFGRTAMEGCADTVEAILRACLEADLTPEINTSTLRQGLTEPMPAPWAVRTYAALGGTALSLGSDAHLPESVGAGFDQAAAALLDAGLCHAAVFEGRRRRMAPLRPEAAVHTS